MDGMRFQAARGYRLDPPEHPQGVSCDEQGPALGPIRLLVEAEVGFLPRPVEELNAVFSRTFGRPLNCADLLPGLRAIARALDEGDLARAMIGTQFLRLPVLGKAEARRAIAAVAMFKASPDDPEHPGWPAGTPGGLGGQFRPKDGETGGDAKRMVGDRLRRLVKRRMVRELLRRLLTWRRVARVVGEVSSNAVPGADVVGDAALAADIVETARDYETLQTDANTALDFVNKGPRSLDELRVSPKDETFPSFDAFKKEDLVKRFGPAGDGYEYHHIVEQGSGDGVPASELQSTKNIVRIPRLLHEEINSEYEQPDIESQASVRASLKGRSFEEKWQRGLEVMRKIAILQ